MACCGSKPKARPAAAPAPAPSMSLGEAEMALGANVQQPGPHVGVIHTTEELPSSLQYWPNGEGRYIRVSKSTYPANAPNEDRCTFAADTDKGYIFAGVWDGHGAAACDITL